MLLGAMALITAPAAADEENKQKWYQVELIVFAFHQGANESTEAWHDQVIADYPPNLTVLRQYRAPSVIRAHSTEEFSDDLSEDSLESLIELFDDIKDVESKNPHRDGTQDLLNTSDQSASPENGLSEKVDAHLALQGPLTQSVELEMFDVSALPTRIDAPMDIRKEPFIALPERELILNRLKSRIDRALDLRLLAHTAWRQPVASDIDSPAVLIQAGEQYGLNFELEGTMVVREKRYLHVATDMFFSEFKKPILSEQENWPTFHKNSSKQSGYSANETNRNGLLINTTDLFKQPANDYIRQLTAELKQSRRVKSEELHYLDHPLFGILVQLTEYQLPDPAMEMEEFDIEQLPPKKELPIISE